MTRSIDHFSTATDMLTALRHRTISSRELVEMHVERISELDRALNSIPVLSTDRAREAAARADAAIARGEQSQLLGLPMTLKESTQVAGLPQTAGLEVLKDFKPIADGRVAKAVFDAGACLLGKTNIPIACGDWQADSPVYGRTKNPWDLTRTPGGSTGGGGAALAAGLTPLEVGSDLGGSIRIPAAYCGVYGHRPSETAVSRAGLAPNVDLPSVGHLMGVQGPLARSALDLELLFDIIAGPETGEDVAWKFSLPPARHSHLQDYRIAVMPQFPWVKASDEMLSKVDELASFLSQRGARVAQAMPAMNLEQYFGDYLRLLAVQVSAWNSAEYRESVVKLYESLGIAASYIGGGRMQMAAADYVELLYVREVRRSRWREFFTEWDVLIGPMALDVAFEHQTGPQGKRVLNIDSENVKYLMNLTYPMWAVHTGQPSTAFPAGRSRAGLPLGLQAIGPYLEDRTTLRFAQLLELEWQGFVPPPGC
ncbi:MAG TPA: amidase family protein [Verrucomicrobiae bacterium]|nr:amidase family protein [Verrucomicrobiae bacterium]